jgi:hypothetical protein
VKSSLLAGLLAVAAGCAAGPPLENPSGVLPGGSLRSEQVVLGAHNDVSGVAASRSMVFAATQDALLIYDPLRRSWLPPLSRSDGYPGGPVTVLAADPLEDGVWAAAFGSVLYYRPQLDLLTSTLVPGVTDGFFFDSRDVGAGAYVRSGGRWSLVSRTGAAFPVSGAQLPPPAARMVPPTLRDVYREFPALQSFAVLLTRDARLRSWPVSAGTRAPDRAEVFLGTRGNGLYRVDPLFQESEHLPYGLLEQGAQSLGLTADGIWVGGAGASPADRGGATFVSSDLQRWLWIEGPRGRPLGRTRIDAVATREHELWLATPRGLFQLHATDAEFMRQWTVASGLPADQVLSVAPTFGGTWVGTARGLAWIPRAVADGPSHEMAQPIAPATPVRALVHAGNTLWIGGDGGLAMIDPADPDRPPRWAPAVESVPRLRRPIRALASSDSILFAATADELFAVDVRSGEVLPGPAGISLTTISAGSIAALAADSRTIWIGGSAGVVIVSRADNSVRQLRAGRDLPAEVTAVVLAPGIAWIATRRGLVRIARLPDGGVR